MIFRRKKRDIPAGSAGDEVARWDDQVDDQRDPISEDDSGEASSQDRHDRKQTTGDVDAAADSDADADSGEDDHDTDENDSVDTGADEVDSDEEFDDEGDYQDDGQDDPWAELDEGDYRDEGPFDIDEVDLEGDEVTRIDLGTMIITPFPGAELRLNVVEGTRQVVSVLIISGKSALELAPLAAPISGGTWAAARAELITETEEAGGNVNLVEGPFGTELRRTMPATGPDGEDGYQPTRTWMAQGPRWALRGVLYGEAALSDALTEDPVLPLFDAFRDVIVRRGDRPQRSGDVLLMTVPEGVGQDVDAESK